jgi:hypothetical protein
MSQEMPVFDRRYDGVHRCFERSDEAGEALKEGVELCFWVFARSFFKRGHSPKLLWHGRLSNSLCLWADSGALLRRRTRGRIDPILPRNVLLSGGSKMVWGMPPKLYWISCKPVCNSAIQLGGQSGAQYGVTARGGKSEFLYYLAVQFRGLAALILMRVSVLGSQK